MSCFNNFSLINILPIIKLAAAKSKICFYFEATEHRKFLPRKPLYVIECMFSQTAPGNSIRKH